MQRIVISAMVFVMMCAIGLRTNREDFAVVWQRPVPYFLALVVNLVAVPLVTLLALSLSHLPEPAAVGILICAASPAGPAGALFALQAGGHVATAVTAMVTLALLSVISAPMTITWLLGRSVAVDVGHLVLPMMATLLFFQLAPLVVGMTLRRYRPILADRLSAPASKLANVLLLVVTLGLLVTKGHLLLVLGLAGSLVCAIIVTVSLGLGAIVSRRGDERRAYATITGVRNLSLALLIGTSYFPEPTTDAGILTFGLFAMILPYFAARIMGQGMAPTRT